MNQFETFQGILGALRAAPIDRQGRLLTNADYTLKVLVSVVGELAAISTNFENSAADRESLAKVLGAISCCNIALHDCYKIGCAEAVATFLNDPAARAKNAHALTVQTPEHGGVTPEADNGLISPRTVSNFFPELDRYRFKSREDYRNELSWFVLSDNGEVIDLKPNGRNIPVMYDELQYYLTLADLHRTKPLAPVVEPVGRVAPPPTVVNSESTPTQRFTKTLQVNAPGYNGEQVAALFSPTHFDNGLFAPLNTQTSLQVTYEKPVHDSPPARGASNNSTSNLGNNSSQTRVGPAQAEVEKFWTLIAKIESQEITPDAVSNYNLTFSVPTADGNTTELIAGGSKICVNRNNLQSFLNLVKEKMTCPSNARVMRTGSIRPMAVTSVPYNPIVDEGKFSPSHFSRDLFAPFTSNTAVNVDLNNQDLVPTFLRNPVPQSYINPHPQQPQQQPQQQQQQQQQIPLGAASTQPQSAGVSKSNLASALRNFSTNRKPAVPSFVDRIKDSDDEFVAILSQLDSDHEKATEFGVTYCIPAACVNKAILASAPQSSVVDGIFDLIPDGRNVPVPPSNVPQYFQMIENAARV